MVIFGNVVFEGELSMLQTYKEDFRYWRIFRAGGRLFFESFFHPVYKHFYIKANCLKQNESNKSIDYVSYTTKIDKIELETIMIEKYGGKKINNTIYFTRQKYAENFIKWIESIEIANKMRDI